MGIQAFLFAVFTAGCMNGAAYASYDPRILLAGFTVLGYKAPVDTPPVLAVFTYICFGIFCFLPVILDVTETIRFSRSRKKKKTDLEKTYREIYEVLEHVQNPPQEGNFYESC